ncbi:MAG: class I SAM-dependent methyltransferase [Stappiaceae bacterium]
MTPGIAAPLTLLDKIRRQILSNGPISIADYMAQCLGDPKFGYYMTKDPFGTAGDFITAPEISQMFGELVGGWCVETWKQLSKPSKFNLIEIGPGRGTLMSDLLRIAALDSEFHAAASIHLIETSPLLKRHQQETLENAKLAVSWHESMASISDAPTILIANELLDALPIRQFMFTDSLWRERVVGVGQDQKLAFGLGAATLDPKSLPNHCHQIDEGTTVEISTAVTNLVEDISRTLLRNGGACLLIDYGYTRFTTGDTLQAVKTHKPTGILDEPGEADLTAHVNFDAVKRAAKLSGVYHHGPLEQGTFLLNLGLLERAGQLGSDKDRKTQEQIRADVERLAAPDQMGNLFKVFAMSSEALNLPGFQN